MLLFLVFACVNKQRNCSTTTNAAAWVTCRSTWKDRRSVWCECAIVPAAKPHFSELPFSASIYCSLCKHLCRLCKSVRLANYVMLASSIASLLLLQLVEKRYYCHIDRSNNNRENVTAYKWIFFLFFFLLNNTSGVKKEKSINTY